MATYKAAVAYNRHFFMVDSTTHLAAKTGLTPTVNISKAGAAFGAAAGAVTEIANGWYRVALTTADTSTTGDLMFHITATGADDTDFADQIVSYDPFDSAALGLSRIDAAVTTRMATFTLPTNFSTLVIDANGRVDLSKWIGVAPNALISGRVDANVGVNSDKTGYSLTQTFPTNFSTLSIDGSGRVDVAKVAGTAQTARDLGAQLDATVSSRLASATVVSQSGTATAGGASTITLTGASATDSIYNGQTVVLLTATGAGQSRVITGYVGATKVATVDRAWQTNPDATTTYAVLALDSAKTDSSLQVVAASVQGNVTGSVASVTGAVGSVTGAVGSVTAGVTVTTNNDKTGYGLSAAAVQATWDAATSALTTVGSIGKRLADDIDASISSRSTFAGGAVASVTGAVGSVAAGGITSSSFGASAIDAAALATDAGQEIADRLIARNIAGGSDTGRTVKMALARLVNRVKIAAGVLTTYDTDDTTALFTQAVTTTAGNPVSEVDTV